MIDCCLRTIIFLCVAVSILAGSGCSESRLENENDFLIRVGERELTVLEFKAAFEIAKSAYPHNEMQNPPAFKAAQERFLNQLTEELVLMEHARELGIDVKESEIEALVSDIKKDYPDDLFDQTLLEYAIPYETWKKRLKTRMLLEKVVQKELKDHISISAKDILSYYESHFTPNSSLDVDEKDIDEVIVEQLRRKKAEDGYRDWIESLRDRYDIRINTVQWERMIGS